MKQTITLLYDGECPICRQYKKYVELRKKYDIALKNAREEKETVRRLREEGYDMNEGMILIIGDDIYHGEQALLRIESLIRPGKFRGAALKRLSASPRLTKAVYACMKGVRSLLLKWKNIDPRF